MNTIKLNVQDGITIGCLIESLLDSFDESSVTLAKQICNDIANQIPAEYYNNDNQLEFKFN